MIGNVARIELADQLHHALCGDESVLSVVHHTNRFSDALRQLGGEVGWDGAPVRSADAPHCRAAECEYAMGSFAAARAGRVPDSLCVDVDLIAIKWSRPPDHEW